MIVTSSPPADRRLFNAIVVLAPGVLIPVRLAGGSRRSVGSHPKTCEAYVH